MLRIFALLVLLLPISAYGATLDNIEFMLSRSGIYAAVKQLDLAYDINLSRQSEAYDLSVPQRERLAKAIAIYRGDDILAELARSMLEEFEQQAAQPIIAALNHDLVEKFRRFERIGDSTGQRQKLEEYVAENTIALERSKLLRACHVADNGPVLAAVIQSFAEVDTAVALDRISGEQFTINDYEGIKLWRSELEKLYAEQYVSSADPYLAYTYRFVRDEQLQQYAAIWQDRNVQWFMDTALVRLRVLLQAKRQRMLDALHAEE